MHIFEYQELTHFYSSSISHQPGIYLSRVDSTCPIPPINLPINLLQLRIVLQDNACYQFLQLFLEDRTVVGEHDGLRLVIQ